MESVSIIIPVFNQGLYLRRAITSVLEQDYANVEIVVVDDASDDESSAIALELQGLDPRVRTLIRKHNGGLGKARNDGLVASRGDLVGFLDSDDYLLPGSISARVVALRGVDDSSIVGAYGDWQHVQEHIEDPDNVRSPRAGLPILDASNYAGFNAFIVTSPLVGRDVLLDAGGFGEGLPMLEDWLLWTRVLEAGYRFLPVQHVVGVYRQRRGSMLRGSGATFPVAAHTINRHWLEAGHHLSDGGRAAAWLRGDQSLGSHRRNWTASSSDGDEFVRPDSQPGGRDALPHPDVIEQFTRALHQPALGTKRDSGVRHARRHHGVAQLCRDPNVGDGLEIVLVPTDVEGALEAATLGRHLAAAGHRVAIGLESRTRLVPLWPAMSTELPVVRLNNPAYDNATHVVWSPDDRFGQHLAQLVGGERVVLRPTGIDSFNVMKRGGQHRYRASRRVIFRTPLEAAEHGDRPHAVVESGARYAAPPSESHNSVGVLVADGIRDYPALDGWAATAINAAAMVDPELRISGSAEIAHRLDKFRMSTSRLTTLTGRVVVPLTNAISLVQSVGGTPIVFAPSLDVDTWSRPWYQSLVLTDTREELVHVLGSQQQPERGPGTVAPAQLHVDEWAALMAAEVLSA